MRERIIRVLELIIEYMPDWICVALGGVIGLALFTSLILLANSLQK